MGASTKRERSSGICRDVWKLGLGWLAQCSPLRALTCGPSARRSTSSTFKTGALAHRRLAASPESAAPSPVFADPRSSLFSFVSSSLISAITALVFARPPARHRRRLGRHVLVECRRCRSRSVRALHLGSNSARSCSVACRADRRQTHRSPGAPRSAQGPRRQAQRLGSSSRRHGPGRGTEQARHRAGLAVPERGAPVPRRLPRRPRRSIVHTLRTHAGGRDRPKETIRSVRESCRYLLQEGREGP